jgi:hypothetical protein
MGKYKTAGRFIGRAVGEEIGRFVGESEANEMLFPYFGRAERRIQKRREEYGRTGEECGDAAGTGADIGETIGKILGILF